MLEKAVELYGGADVNPTLFGYSLGQYFVEDFLDMDLSTESSFAFWQKRSLEEIKDLSEGSKMGELAWKDFITGFKHGLGSDVYSLPKITHMISPNELENYYKVLVGYQALKIERERNGELYDEQELRFIKLKSTLYRNGIRILTIIKRAMSQWLDMVERERHESEHSLRVIKEAKQAMLYINDALQSRDLDDVVIAIQISLNTSHIHGPMAQRFLDGPKGESIEDFLTYLSNHPDAEKWEQEALTGRPRTGRMRKAQAYVISSRELWSYYKSLYCYQVLDVEHRKQGWLSDEQELRRLKFKNAVKTGSVRILQVALQAMEEWIEQISIYEGAWQKVIDKTNRCIDEVNNAIVLQDIEDLVLAVQLVIVMSHSNGLLAERWIDIGDIEHVISNVRTINGLLTYLSNYPDAEKWEQEALTGRSRIGKREGGSEIEAAIDYTLENNKTPEGWWVHGRSKRDSLRDDAVILMIRSLEVAEGYAAGNGSIWIMRPASTSRVVRLEDLDGVRELSNLFEKNPDGLCESLWSISESYGYFEAAKWFAPDAIVDSAGGWDDWQAVECLVDNYTGHGFFVTPDGAVATNRGEVDAYKINLDK